MSGKAAEVPTVMTTLALRRFAIPPRRFRAGQQKMTVEHVHVYEGGQAIVGNVGTPGGGFAPKSKEQPHALEYAPGTTMPSADTTREPVSVAGDEERSMPNARRNVTGRTEGE